jgi:hypothetical protein
MLDWPVHLFVLLVYLSAFFYGIVAYKKGCRVSTGLLLLTAWLAHVCVFYLVLLIVKPLVEPCAEVAYLWVWWSTAIRLQAGFAFLYIFADRCNQ